MSQNRLPPPEYEVCLVRLRSSSQKGGTIIAEEVTDLATHDRRICDLDGYRPAFCPSCGHSKLHIHDYRKRVLRAEPGEPVVRVVRHECAGCEAVWQILPAFIARHLWRSWQLVEHVLSGPAAARQAERRRWAPVAERTRRRWRARWRRPARYLAEVLASSGEAAWSALVVGLSTTATCAELVAAYTAAQAMPGGQRLAAVAALIYRLQPKVRLM